MRRPRYADVTATLALVLAMGGTAYGVGASYLPADSVDTQAIQGGAVTTPKLANEAVTSPKISPQAVTAGKVAADAITGANVVNHSLTLADLAGANVAGPISFSFAKHSCGYLRFSVAGAKVGQTAVLTWTGTTNPPQGLMVGPLKVVAAGHIVASGCNVTGHRITGLNLRVRVVTFG